MSEAAPTVFVVDDDPAVLKGLERLLRSARLNVATFASPQEFLQRHDPRAHGCLLLDVAMPDLNGLELQNALAERGSATPIVFLSGQGDVPTSVRAMKRGAVDFLTKPVNDEDLLAAVHAALRNDQLARRARAEVDEIAQRLATLTPREREVLGHVIAGHLNKQAAAAMGTVEKTIKVHRARMMEKMGVQSVAELVRLAEKAQVAPAAPTSPPTAC
jgi:FixJ family two-component response regulator